MSDSYLMGLVEIKYCTFSVVQQLAVVVTDDFIWLEAPFSHYSSPTA